MKAEPARTGLPNIVLDNLWMFTHRGEIPLLLLIYRNRERLDRIDSDQATTVPIDQWKRTTGLGVCCRREAIMRLKTKGLMTAGRGSDTWLTFDLATFLDATGHVSGSSTEGRRPPGRACP